MQKRNIVRLALILIIISAPFVLYLNSTLLLVFCPDAYIAGFQSNNVYDNFANKTTPDQTVAQLIDYFKGNQQEPPQLFDQNEKDHLKDVKLLIDNLIKFLYIYT